MYVKTNILLMLKKGSVLHFYVVINKKKSKKPLNYGNHLINSLSASLLLNIFLSFEVGIAHAIANFKWKENTSSLKNKPAKFHNGGFTQDLYMHICSISVKF